MRSSIGVGVGIGIGIVPGLPIASTPKAIPTPTPNCLNRKLRASNEAKVSPPNAAVVPDRAPLWVGILYCCLVEMLQSELQRIPRDLGI